MREQFLFKKKYKNSTFINKENLIFLFLFPIVSIFQFNYLNFFFLTVLVINQILKFNFYDYQKIIFKIYVILLFLKRYLIDIPNEKFLNSLNNDIFWDAQLFLLQLRCNFDEEFSYNFQLSKNFINCLDGGVGYDGTVNIGFGPLSKILKFNLDIWNITVIISILFGVALIIFLIKMEISEKNLFKFSLLLSPSFIFLFDTMNLDIAIFLVLVMQVGYYFPYNIFNI